MPSPEQTGARWGGPAPKAELGPLLARIRAAFPDHGFEQAELIEEGYDHAVVVLDGAWVFRFPRQAAYVASFPVELRLLKALRPLTTFEVPDYSRVAPDFGGYRLIQGRALTAPLFARMGRPAQEQILTELAGFLRDLHGLSPDLMRGQDGAVRTDEGWAATDARSYRKRRRPKLVEALGPDLIGRLDRAHERYPEIGWRRDAVIHGDFREAHLLLAAHANRMAGVIDFGDAVHGDPAYDFTFFWALADWAAPFALAAYGPVDDREGFLERSRWSFIRYAASRLVLALRGEPDYGAAALIAQVTRRLDEVGL
ncbi:phosphotransferase family protein [Phenylobacterium sp.]|uniref:phosphotransferase family protein n=1 Tax=Phenylobacterium sp. TaxID=1871053 RepID=UPI0027180ECE|nr:aminoglycoside phosphotransferase family protein [Phenylobacterium sp.]MDO8800105.1 aminoglycoside phosphotransferase family protein [Phenylobacterium sp.]